METNVLYPENSIAVFRGTSQSLELTVVEPRSADATVRCGSEESRERPTDLTNTVIHFTAKKYVTDVVPSIYKSSLAPSEVLITNAVGGKATIFLIPGDTRSLTCGPYVFDVFVVFSTGPRAGQRICVIPTSTLDLLPTATVLPA